jgi:hypothetical protein
MSSTGNYKHLWNLGECGDDFLGYPVAEILLLGVSAYVVKRQYRNGRLVRQLKLLTMLWHCHIKVHQDPIHRHWLRDVLDSVLSQVFISEIQFVFDLVVNIPRNADASREI